MAVDAAMSVLAHQGQWDEVLLVAIPLALFAWVLHSANRRADRANRPTGQPSAPDTPAASSSPASSPSAPATPSTPPTDEH